MIFEKCSECKNMFNKKSKIYIIRNKFEFKVVVCEECYKKCKKI